MSDLFDYLEWRGDLTFAQDPFHDLDALILSQISYFTVEKVMTEEDQCTLAELWEKLKDGSVSSRFVEKRDKRFLEALAGSERYRNLVICNLSCRQDEELMIQFAAMTILLPDGTPYLSYRGTDMSIVGWKEDFYLAFPEAIPAQLCAKEYLEKIAALYEKPLLLGGHSKGGNLALYAASVITKEIQDRIQMVYIYDGPGLTEELFQSEGYERIKERLQVYLPEQSMVGILLMHPEQYSIVKSNASGIMQHDPYTWQVKRKKYELAGELKKESVYLETVVKEWLKEAEEEELKSFVDTMFEILGSSQAVSLDELAKCIRKNPKLLLQAIHEVDEETHKTVMQTMGMMAGTAFHEATTEIRIHRKKLTRRRMNRLMELLPLKNAEQGTDAEMLPKENEISKEEISANYDVDKRDR